MNTETAPTASTTNQPSRPARRNRKVAQQAPAKAKQVKHLTESRVNTPVSRVHAFLDKNPKMRRCDAIRALEKQGVAYYTARTQFQRWFSARRKASRKSA